MVIESALTDAAILSELGRRLAETRLERNLSQTEVAARAGVGVATLQRLEEGRPVAATTLIRVLRVLGLADRLDVLVPEPLPSPLEQLKLQGRRRRRAGGSRRSGQTGEPTPWRWGDEPAS